MKRILHVASEGVFRYLLMPHRDQIPVYFRPNQWGDKMNRPIRFYSFCAICGIAISLYAVGHPQAQVLNPFVQPNINHSIYGAYGSGDVDGNEAVGWSDHQAMLDGEMNDRGDVDGDGTSSTEADQELLFNFLSGTIPYLPGHWNSLQTPDERMDWVSLMLAIDQTDTVTAHWPDWACMEFGSQTFMNFNGYNGDFTPDEYFEEHIGRFNIPFFYLQVSHNSSSWGHAANATLVGDDPSSFEDWCFIEPQLDQVDVHPGSFTIPLNSTLWTAQPYDYNVYGAPNYNSYVFFNVDTLGIDSLISVSEDLFLIRPDTLNTIVPDTATSFVGTSHFNQNNTYILQNYPNPFNQTTRIEYRLSVASLVKLEVFDLLGRRIAVLQNGRVSAGLHSVPFSANALASGQYIYRLSTPTSTISRQVTLVK